MPELPEVETTRRGIAPALVGRRVAAVRVRDPRLRWPVPEALSRELPGRVIEQVTRRGKYLLLRAGDHTLLLHLGMSGSLRLVPHDRPPGLHDHLDVLIRDGVCLRLRDPRRFGAALWYPGEPLQHPLLARLGPEPLDAAFHADDLYRRTRGKRLAVKSLLMDSHTVVGVGNIYANEALYLAGIHPARAVGRIGLRRYQRLVEAVREVLEAAIAQGGTTLRDFRVADGRPGYFAQSLNVYDRADQPCPACATPLRRIRLGQRSTYYCPRCQR